MDSLKGTLTPMKVLNGTLNGGIAYGTFNYNELENKPSVNGTELVGNVNIPIPTKTSDLTNDSGFITDADVPTKTSDLTNDSGFITDADIPTKTSDLTNDSGFITSADIPTIPTKTSELNNDSGFLTINTIPVRSVNSLTGDVNLFIPNATSQLNNDAGFITDADAPVKSVNGQTGDVNLFIPNATSQLTNDAGYITNPQTGTIEDVEVASFSDGADNVPVSELIVDIKAEQDLHGYDQPWAGGAGKNKLDLTSITPQRTENGITFTVNADGTFKANGTATDRCQLVWAIPKAIAQTFGGMILNGCVSQTDVRLMIESTNYPYKQYAIDTGSGATISASIASMSDDHVNLIFRVGNGTLNNVTIKPMIRLATVSDDTFAPYSNICPITGFDSGVIKVTDNDQATNNYTVDFGQTVYGGYFDNRGNLVVTHEYIASYNGETINEPWISSIDEYAPNTSPSTGAEVVYPLSAPNTIQLTPVQVKTLLNNNNISANTGNIEKLVYFKTGCEAIAKLIEAMIQ